MCIFKGEEESDGRTSHQLADQQLLANGKLLVVGA